MINEIDDLPQLSDFSSFITMELSLSMIGGSTAKGMIAFTPSKQVVAFAISANSIN
jgi:hypothetical protein